MSHKILIFKAGIKFSSTSKPPQLPLSPPPKIDTTAELIFLQGIDSVESMPGVLKSLKFRAQYRMYKIVHCTFQTIKIGSLFLTCSLMYVVNMWFVS